VQLLGEKFWVGKRSINVGAPSESVEVGSRRHKTQYIPNLGLLIVLLSEESCPRYKKGLFRETGETESRQIVVKYENLVVGLHEAVFPHKILPLVVDDDRVLKKRTRYNSGQFKT